MGEVVGAVATLQSFVAGFRPEDVSGTDAVRLVEVLAQGERLCAAGRALAAKRVEEANSWVGRGQRSVAHWMAQAAGTTVAQARAALDTASGIAACPEVEDAFRKGKLSVTQAEAIASAASVDPSQAPRLLSAASTLAVGELKERCRRIKAAAAGHDAYRRIHANRHVRTFTDGEGAFRLVLYTTPDAGARAMAAVEPFRVRIFDQARKEGRREPAEAYLADAVVEALCASVGSDGSGPSAVVNVVVDHDTLVKGQLSPGGVCEITGVGPVPPAVARSLATDAFIKVLESDGVEVRRVAHLGRSATAAQKSALALRDPVCVVPGCGVRKPLQIDHIRGWTVTKLTAIDDLCRLCVHHHHLKTHDGWRIEGGPGQWRFLPPEDPDPAKSRGP